MKLTPSNLDTLDVKKQISRDVIKMAFRTGESYIHTHTQREIITGPVRRDGRPGRAKGCVAACRCRTAPAHTAVRSFGRRPRRRGRDESETRPQPGQWPPGRLLHP